MRSKPFGILVLAILVGVLALARGWFVRSAPPAPPPAQVAVPPPVMPAAPPTAVAPPKPVPSKPVPVESARKVEVLKEILASRNDNDPRLDSEFREMTPETKAALRAYYNGLGAEQLNSRGTVVFLIGRALTSPEDASFLQSVMQEKPCLSIGRCDANPPSHSGDNDMNNEVTLAYPQIVAARSLGQNWAKIQDPDQRAQLLQSLEEASRSTNPALARIARESLAKAKAP